MDLEADLGVDSIKRVEILSAMQEQAPDLPEVDPAELAKLATLQQIVDRMGAALGSAPTQATAPAQAAAPAPPSSSSSCSTSSPKRPATPPTCSTSPWTS